MSLWRRSILTINRLFDIDEYAKHVWSNQQILPIIYQVLRTSKRKNLEQLGNDQSHFLRLLVSSTRYNSIYSDFAGSLDFFHCVWDLSKSGSHSEWRNPTIQNRGSIIHLEPNNSRFWVRDENRGSLSPLKQHYPPQVTKSFSIHSDPIIELI